MKKSDSLLLLDMLGLNTIDYFITQDEREATHYLAKHLKEKRSMRTERGYEFLCPFYYNLPGEELLPKALQHLKEGYKLIFSNSLDWRDSIAFGSLALVDKGEDCIEFVHGPGLCRDLEKHKERQSINILRGTVFPFFKQDHALFNELNTLYKKVKNSCYDQIPCIVEWSLYPYLVGKNQENFIFWELRGYNK